MRVRLRYSVVAALLLTTSTGVVLASSTACQVAVLDQLHRAQGAVRKRVHHSAATLARWKIGAAAWSKSHNGKVYAGVPAPKRQDWTPLRFTCDDVALDPTRPDEDLLLPFEDQPELAAYEAPTPFGGGSGPATVPPLPTETTWQQASLTPYTPFAPVPLGGVAPAGGGSAPDAPVGPTSFPPAPVPPVLASPVPTPESPTIVLLSMGMVSFLVSKLRRRTVV